MAACLLLVLVFAVACTDAGVLHRDLHSQSRSSEFPDRYRMKRSHEDQEPEIEADPFDSIFSDEDIWRTVEKDDTTLFESGATSTLQPSESSGHTMDTTILNSTASGYGTQFSETKIYQPSSTSASFISSESTKADLSMDEISSTPKPDGTTLPFTISASTFSDITDERTSSIQMADSTTLSDTSVPSVRTGSAIGNEQTERPVSASTDSSITFSGEDEFQKVVESESFVRSDSETVKVTKEWPSSISEKDGTEFPEAMRIHPSDADSMDATEHSSPTSWNEVIPSSELTEFQDSEYYDSLYDYDSATVGETTEQMNLISTEHVTTLSEVTHPSATLDPSLRSESTSAELVTEKIPYTHIKDNTIAVDVTNIQTSDGADVIASSDGAVTSVTIGTISSTSMEDGKTLSEVERFETSVTSSPDSTVEVVTSDSPFSTEVTGFQLSNNIATGFPDSHNIVRCENAMEDEDETVISQMTKQEVLDQTASSVSTAVDTVSEKISSDSTENGESSSEEVTSLEPSSNADHTFNTDLPTVTEKSLSSSEEDQSSSSEETSSKPSSTSYFTGGTEDPSTEKMTSTSLASETTLLEDPTSKSSSTSYDTASTEGTAIDTTSRTLFSSETTLPGNTGIKPCSSSHLTRCTDGTIAEDTPLPSTTETSSTSSELPSTSDHILIISESFDRESTPSSSQVTSSNSGTTSHINLIPITQPVPESTTERYLNTPSISLTTPSSAAARPQLTLNFVTILFTFCYLCVNNF